jgi:hypothetical protein
MRLLSRASDGGKDSGVTGFFVVEIKSLFSVVLLHFRPGSREAYHSHAFNAVTWFIRGRVAEHRINPECPSEFSVREYGASIRPKFTPRENHHKVVSLGHAWALSFRGPWTSTWREYRAASQEFVTLANGRRVVETTYQRFREDGSKSFEN